jgi:hypothetical protein
MPIDLNASGCLACFFQPEIAWQYPPVVGAHGTEFCLFTIVKQFRPCQPGRQNFQVRRISGWDNSAILIGRQAKLSSVCLGKEIKPPHFRFPLSTLVVSLDVTCHSVRSREHVAVPCQARHVPRSCEWSNMGRRQSHPTMSPVNTDHTALQPSCGHSIESVSGYSW